MPSKKAPEQKPDKPCTVHEYSLTGPQVEPQAGYWAYCARLCVVSIEELTAVTDNPKSDGYFPPYPDPCSPAGAAQIKKEIDELLALAKRRDDPCSLSGAAQGALGPRKPISKFLNLTPPALGAVVVNRFPGEQIIRTGRGMARAIESETPGLYHRHALNYLISTRHWSPPRQALVWAALDVAIISALQAAWYYKWLADTDAAINRRPLTSFRERPIEYAKRNGIPLDVLFDRPDELNPAYSLCPDARPKPDGTMPDVMAGTPRHPAYPSGHSTYTGAASEILSFFFGKAKAFAGAQPSKGTGLGSTLIKDEVENMADNIGLGRMWAGIHWRTDHENGAKLGRTVAKLVLRKLAAMGIDLCPPEPPSIMDQCDRRQTVPCNTTTKPPTRKQLAIDAKKFRDNCGKPKKQDPDPCPAPPEPLEDRLDANRGVQQGAR
jgi:hypothetical protein